MSSETKALTSLALMRDQKLVFLGVREVLEKSGLPPDQMVAEIREYYAAFDADHPRTT
jgi:hypothetical protein